MKKRVILIIALFCMAVRVEAVRKAPPGAANRNQAPALCLLDPGRPMQILPHGFNHFDYRGAWLRLRTERYRQMQPDAAGAPLAAQASEADGEAPAAASAADELAPLYTPPIRLRPYSDGPPSTAASSAPADLDS